MDTILLIFFVLFIGTRYKLVVPALSHPSASNRSAGHHCQWFITSRDCFVIRDVQLNRSNPPPPRLLSSPHAVFIYVLNALSRVTSRGQVQRTSVFSDFYKVFYPLTSLSYQLSVDKSWRNFFSFNFFIFYKSWMFYCPMLFNKYCLMAKLIQTTLKYLKFRRWTCELAFFPSISNILCFFSLRFPTMDERILMKTN